MGRSRKQKNRFGCGHRGYGAYCHRCVEAKKLGKKIMTACALPRVSTQQLWTETFATDEIDLRHLPKPIVLKTRQILQSLQQGVGYWQLGGKRLKALQKVIRIPVTYRYRLLGRLEQGRVVPLRVLSHEDYNPLVRSKRRLMAILFSRGLDEG